MHRQTARTRSLSKPAHEARPVRAFFRPREPRRPAPPTPPPLPAAAQPRRPHPPPTPDLAQQGTRHLLLLTHTNNTAPQQHPTPYIYFPRCKPPTPSLCRYPPSRGPEIAHLGSLYFINRRVAPYLLAPPTCCAFRCNYVLSSKYGINYLRTHYARCENRTCQGTPCSIRHI